MTHKHVLPDGMRSTGGEKGRLSYVGDMRTKTSNKPEGVVIQEDCDSADSSNDTWC